MARKSLKARSRASQEFLDDQVEDAGIVAFDFDGTLTVRDSFMAFLKWRVDGARFNAGMMRMIPAALGYIGHRNRGRSSLRRFANS